MSKLDKKKEELGLFKLFIVALLGIILGITSYIVTKLESGIFGIFSLLGLVTVCISLVMLVVIYFRILDILNDIEEL